MNNNLCKSAVFSPKDLRGKLSCTLLNEETCRKLILEKVHPRGFFCPECGFEVVDAIRLMRLGLNQRVACSNCGKFFDARTRTFLSGMRLSFAQLFLLSLLLSFDVPPPEIARAVEVDLATTHVWRKRFAAISYALALERIPDPMSDHLSALDHIRTLLEPREEPDDFDKVT
jgi:transposase-like protein